MHEIVGMQHRTSDLGVGLAMAVWAKLERERERERERGVMNHVEAWV
jgi:hypothetical protein